MIGSKLIERTALHKLVRFGHGQVRNIWAQPLVLTPVVLATLVVFLSLGFLDGIRPFFVLYLIVALLLSYKLQSFFTGFFLTFIFTLQFVHPNKLYSIEVIRGSEILERAYSDGYSIAYFFNLGSFFFVLSLGALIREFILKKKELKRPFLNILLAVFGAWMLFFLVSIYGITRFSPYTFLSTVWLFQYGMMYYVAIGICFGLATQKNFQQLLFSVFGVIIGVQFVISVLQLIFQRSVGLPFEATSVGSFATGLDENNAVFRVMGTFMFPNQLSLISGFLTALVLPYSLEKKSLTLVLAACMGLMVTALTQSRLVMIGMAYVVVLNLLSYKEHVWTLVRKVGTRRLSGLGLAAFILSAFSLIPRIILSVNTGYAGAGLAIRFRMFKEAADAITGSPIIGYGIGTNEYVLHRLFPNGVTSVFPAVVHMGYLQLWLEVGILGLVIFLLPLLFLLRFCIVVTKKIQDQNFYRIGYIGGLVTVLLFWILLPHVGIVEFPFLGCVLGAGTFWYYLSTTNKGKHEKST